MNQNTLRGIAAFFLASAASAATVQVEQGRLAGDTRGDVESFKGVPFAAPPVGPLRWCAPQPAAAWPGVRGASRYAPACLQGGAPWPPDTPAEPQDEDCLYLNVWRPAGIPTGAQLPVMVWIPGGGWTDGSGSAPLYDGGALARRGVVVVTINYRVGAFGFLAHPALSRENPLETSGNDGLRDQVAALRWVQRNIGAFGGDAARVTVFGQSAGSMSAHLLTVSPPARGLFRRVIGQSGAVFIPATMAGGDAFALSGAETQGARFAAALGASTTEALRKVPAAAIVEAQRGFAFHFILEAVNESGVSERTPQKRPIKAQSAAVVPSTASICNAERALLGGTSGHVGFVHSFLDHEMLPEEPWAAYRAGRQAPVDLLAGWNADEGQLFIAGRTVTAATLESGIAEEIGAFPAPLRPWYRATTDAEARGARAAFEGDLRIGYDTWTWLRLQADSGRGKVFAYRFEQVPPAPAGSALFGLGATHGSEMVYAFDGLAAVDWAWRPTDRRLAATMADQWTRFAKTGDPNGPGLPRWPRYRPGSAGHPPQVLRLGDPIRATPEKGIEPLRAMDSVFQAVRGADAVATPGR